MTTGWTTGRWFVKFYAPVALHKTSDCQWCGHCKKLAPVWEDLADAVVGELNIAEVFPSSWPQFKVDATENNELSRMYSIKAFPTLIFFNNVFCFLLLLFRVNTLFMKEAVIWRR